MDFDGLNQGSRPIQAMCNFEDGSTVVGEVIEVEPEVCHSPRCSNHSIKYASMDQVTSLIQRSSQCYQMLEIDCVESPLKDYDQETDQLQNSLSWTGRDNVENEVTSLGDNSCNQRSQSRITNSGKINQKDKLPISFISYGPRKHEG